MEDDQNNLVNNEETLPVEEPKTFTWVANTPTKSFNQVSSENVVIEYTPDGWVVKR